MKSQFFSLKSPCSYGFHPFRRVTGGPASAATEYPAPSEKAPPSPREAPGMRARLKRWAVVWWEKTVKIASHM